MYAPIIPIKEELTVTRVVVTDDNNGWIRVEDRLPEVGEDYNVVLDLKDNMGPPVSGIMEFDGILHKWIYPGSNIVCNDVTHWQPLPPPPTI